MQKIREKQDEVGVDSGGLPGEDGEPIIPAGLDPKVLMRQENSPSSPVSSRPMFSMARSFL
jgi:hypothetical protein